MKITPHERKVYVHRVSANMLMLSTQFETIEERCRQQPVTAFPIVKERMCCMQKQVVYFPAVHSTGWRFRFLMKHSRIVNAADVFSLDVPA